MNKFFAVLMIGLSLFVFVACCFLLNEYYGDQMFTRAIVVAVALCAVTFIASLQVAEWAWQKRILPDALRLF
jgi:hypothetical protein